MAATTFSLRFHRIGRGVFLGGVLLTLAVHGALMGLVWFAHVKSPPPPEAPRDLMVTRLVTLGKKRDKFLLPRIVQPPQPKAPEPTIKLSDDLNAAPAQKEAPRPDDAKMSKELRRALERARALSQASAPEEPPEGSLTGSAQGTATQASAGDEYATAIFEAIKRNWNVPAGLTQGDLTGLVAEVRVFIGEDGELTGPRPTKRSGNDLFDASCLQAIEATRKVPPPPAAVRARFRRGTLLVFDGGELAR